MVTVFGCFKDRAVGFGAWCAVIACAVMMFLVVINAITRFIWASIPGTLEIVEALMAVTAVMMLADTQAQKGHIGVEIVLNRMRRQVQKTLNCVTLLLASVFLFFLAMENCKMGFDAWKAKDFATTYPHVPLYPSKLMVCAGLSLLWLQVIADWIKSIKQLFGNGSEVRELEDESRLGEGNGR